MSPLPGGCRENPRIGDGFAVLEIALRATTCMGRDYENHYCLVFELTEGGLVTSVKEYHDAQAHNGTRQLSAIAQWI